MKPRPSIQAIYEEWLKRQFNGMAPTSRNLSAKDVKLESCFKLVKQRAEDLKKQAEKKEPRFVHWQDL